MSLNGDADPQKRAAFDKYGSDPESRFGGSGGPSFATSSFGRGGMQFDAELSPEDLFNMFFGGGGFGGDGNINSFGGGPSKLSLFEFLFSLKSCLCSFHGDLWSRRSPNLTNTPDATTSGACGSTTVDIYPTPAADTTVCLFFHRFYPVIIQPFSYTGPEFLFHTILAV